MQVTEVANEGLKRAYTVVVPAGDIAAERKKRLAELGRDLRIPGFRPGKVPPKVVEQRYGQAVMGEVLEQSVNKATDQVVTDRGLRPAVQPKIELVNFAPETDLEFKVELEVLPEIPMPDFAGIAVERLKAEPSEEQVEKALETIASRNRKLEDVAEPKPTEKGDILVCDFVGRIDPAEGEEGPGEAFPGGTATDMPVEVDGPGFIPGFTEQLVGMNIGDEREVKVTFPEEYGSKDLAGKKATFTVTAKGLKRSVTPPADEDLAKSIGFETLDALKEAVKGSLQQEYDQLARLKVKRALLDALANRAEFPVPGSMIEAEFGQIWQRVEQDLKAGRLDEDDKGKDEETLKAEYRGIAERRIRLGLLLSEIGRTNNITVTGDELARAMRQEAARYPGQEQMVMDFFRKNPQAADNLRNPIFEEKVVDFMLELAQVTDRTVSPEELTAPAAA
ncbi:trigger factor [Paracraurococcus lichenis]|uniref:Trigger factor n=1 Tax=Paracraurococcus lichenis TaxID=3064888 RepID=A0ABT9DVD3_9PROT|nr:trigger factor [Paracraurococcus sp. LOR1-02]MDO9707858.1 trigger factor [Paracraurococcus sp. LOR1-02]